MFCARPAPLQHPESDSVVFVKQDALKISLISVNARWGDSRSPAYGTLSDYQFMRRHADSDKQTIKVNGNHCVLYKDF